MNSKISGNFAIEADRLLSVGKTREAVSVCKKGLSAYPEYHTGYGVLARAFILQKDYDKAELTINTGLKLFPYSRALLVVKDALDKTDRTAIPKKEIKESRPYLIRLAVILFIVFLPILLVVTVMPFFLPTWSSAIAENMRGIFGVGLVSNLEEISFSLQDKFNNALYKIGDKQEINIEYKADGSNKSNINDSLTAGLLKNGWEALHSYNGENIIYSKKLYPDSSRPFAQVFFFMMRIDKIRLNFSADGKIPKEKQDNNLLAAFNGGFRLIHGRYGIMHDRDLDSKPVNNIGTVFMYDDGRVDIDKWLLKDSIPTNIISFRQNCPLIVEKGQLSKEIQNKNPAIWGFTIDNAQATWRSGLGITLDKKYLIYCLGKSLTVSTLAKGFRECGVFNAIQLDINRAWTKFVIYPQSEPKTAKKLLRDLCVSKNEYLTRTDNIHKRDFFYICFKH